MKKIKCFLLDILLFACIIGGLYFGYRIQRRIKDDTSLNRIYEEVRKEKQGKRIPWERLKKENPDLVGWIFVKGTKIDYPVVQGKNNEEYLHQTFRKTYAYGGCIFMNSDCNMKNSQNLLIYGHHMRNGSMFADLMKFRSSTFAKKHSIYFYTPQKTYRLHAFSVYAQREELSFPITFSKQVEFQNYKEMMHKKSDVKLSRPADGKKMFTFVTCSYEGDNYRTYVHATEP